MGEDLLNGAADEEDVGERSQGTEGEVVVEPVAHECAAGGVFEFVAMMPEFVGTFDLRVDEEIGWLEGFDARLPFEADAVEAEFVVDESAGLHGDGRRGEDMKAEEGGRDAFKVEGVGKERKDFGARAWDQEAAFEVVGHGGSMRGRGGGDSREPTQAKPARALAHSSQHPA